MCVRACLRPQTERSLSPLLTAPVLWLSPFSPQVPPGKPITVPVSQTQTEARADGAAVPFLTCGVWDGAGPCAGVTVLHSVQFPVGFPCLRVGSTGAPDVVSALAVTPVRTLTAPHTPSLRLLQALPRSAPPHTCAHLSFSWGASSLETRTVCFSVAVPGVVRRDHVQLQDPMTD